MPTTDAKSFYISIQVDNGSRWASKRYSARSRDGTRALVMNDTLLAPVTQYSSVVISLMLHKRVFRDQCLFELVDQTSGALHVSSAPRTIRLAPTAQIEGGQAPIPQCYLWLSVEVATDLGSLAIRKTGRQELSPTANPSSRHPGLEQTRLLY
ncbi:hypothetical protein PENSPDRAFT_319462 [Peniophora sp. CONT]|nr:hypothetical protein PENSPDRAFT_319462 [Peniophora sp. CONT]